MDYQLLESNEMCGHHRHAGCDAGPELVALGLGFSTQDL